MKLAIVRVRGVINVRHDITLTLKSLNLNNNNECVIVEDTPIIRGMIKKALSYITFGTVDEKIAAKIGKWKNMQPPKKGFGRKGIKVAFSRGGAIGDRKEKINDLLMRMM